MYALAPLALLGNSVRLWYNRMCSCSAAAVIYVAYRSLMTHCRLKVIKAHRLPAVAR